jgi:hypothetical protein
LFLIFFFQVTILGERILFRAGFASALVLGKRVLNNVHFQRIPSASLGFPRYTVAVYSSGGAIVSHDFGQLLESFDDFDISQRCGLGGAVYNGVGAPDYPDIKSLQIFLPNYIHDSSELKWRFFFSSRVRTSSALMCSHCKYSKLLEASSSACVCCLTLPSLQAQRHPYRNGKALRATAPSVVY